MRLCDLRRCRMADAVLLAAAAFACLLHCFHSNAAAFAAVAQCLLQGCALLELLPGASQQKNGAAACIVIN